MFFDAEWLQSVVDVIKSGLIDKAVRDNVTVYRVGNIIRIDIKN